MKDRIFGRGLLSWMFQVWVHSCIMSLTHPEILSVAMAA